MQPYVIVPSEGSDLTDEWIRLGMEAQLAGKFPEAERYYRHALRLDPRSAIATQNLATLFAQLGNVNEALLTIERAALFGPNFGVIHVNRAFMNLEADRIDEALDSARAAVASTVAAPVTVAEKAGYVAARHALAAVLTTAGHPEQALLCYEEILAVEPLHAVAGPNVCFVQTLTAATPAELLAQRRRWHQCNAYAGPRTPHLNDRTPHRVLRVGYVSGDFKRHSASMIFSAVCLHHDRKIIDPYFYSALVVNPDADPVTKAYRDCAGPNWRDISGLDDAKAAELIRTDKIDILVDLSGHTNGGRLALFTHKPAPVQVTAWGFAHGTGCPEIDYFIADPVALPAEEVQHYAERIVHLPCVVTYAPPVDYNLKGTSMLPYHKNEFITFGSYARYEKLSDACLVVFGEILRAVPESRLEFKDHAFRRPYSIRRILAALPDIDPARLLFSISTGHPEHLLAYQQADLILDHFPHSGGVVGLEQLYMGVPVITLYGSQPAGRTTSSILQLMGRGDWVARTPQEYAEKAVALANDIPQLTAARKVLRQELLASPVVLGYRERVEGLYQEMWKGYCAA